MRIEHLYLAAIVAFASILGACVTPPIPYISPVSVTPPSGNVAVSQAVNLFDASGSLEAEFAKAKATLESLVAAMPSGSYQAGHVHFGGYDRESTGMSSFNRGTLAGAARNAEFLEGTTPIFDVLQTELADAIGGGTGKAAVVLLSDGRATDYAGRMSAAIDDRTIEAARDVAAGRSGAVCFHTVDTGMGGPQGSALLQAIANVSSCGSYRTAASLGTASALQAFSRDVYLGGAAPAPKPAPRPVEKVGDADGDGVIDTADRCPNTLREARVDRRGCWTLKGLRFAVNGASIEPTFREDLREDMVVLRANPSVRIRIDGHTDSDGSEAYNQDLSLRRAAAVRDYFVSEGLDASRFKVQGFGESQPIAPNDSPLNKRLNRRVELTIID